MAAKKPKTKTNKKPVARARKTRDLVDIRLMKALSHKERVEVLSILSEREASPSELSESEQVPVKISPENAEGGKGSGKVFSLRPTRWQS